MPLSGSSNLPVAPRGTPWNATKAKERVLEACGGNVACISRAFLWRSDGDARSPEVWSLGFCDVVDGRLHIVPKAIAACAGGRGIGSFAVNEEARGQIQARITAIYDRVRTAYPDWPASPFAAITADASGTPISGAIALEGVATGDGRFIEEGALTWEDGPWPLVFDRQEMDHSGATVGTINAIERREGGVVWGTGNLSETEDPETALLVLRAAELFNEGAVGVSISIDDVESAMVDQDGKVIDMDNPDESVDWEKATSRVTKARIRSVAIVDEAAFSPAKMSLAAGVTTVEPSWFSDPAFGDESDDRLVWQEPERPEEERQLGAPLQITQDGRIYGHAALWGRCHVGYPGTCVRPPKEHAAYRGFLTGERLPGIPTGPLVMRTTHASLKSSAQDAKAHYDHTGYAVGDVAIGADRYGIWVAGAVRPDATAADVDILRGSALSGDWRVIGGQMKLVGLLVVNAPGFRVSRAMAASGAMVTVGPGCASCDDEVSLEDRVARLETLLASALVSESA